ncbi:high frequency lysogenization protein HflD [Thiomicrorhabdus sp. 6S3-12]|uniref:high frequency lysogenization protein HflD n=1 Tax=Thiomicrorhabdus sp. 6S3-12 TaxID=2819681 RepID=UPI001AAC55FF|nr:high frequency lysogenization protein HflD [Thiomicrorhabdus sp. 6S3-12]MBO1924037.1 high frequency lysogenization protein HflD [Thiomicrorhabdus sp. 6S3-12]
MSDYSQQDRTLALVGIYQCAKMVHDLASTGETDDKAFAASIQSLFVDNPSSTLNVFGDTADNLQLGVETLLAQMKADMASENRNLVITRYVLNLMILAKKLKQQETPLNQIATVLDTAKAQQEHFGDLHENMIATIARAYTENVSNLQPRIMVNGHHNYLGNQRIANKIRALLLAGIRSTLLWYQVGGTRWNLIWSRKKYLQDAKILYRPQTNTSSSDKITNLFSDREDDQH